MMIRPATPQASQTESPTPIGCPACGHNNSQLAKFCAECAAKLEDSEAAAASPAKSVGAPPQPPQQPNFSASAFPNTSGMPGAPRMPGATASFGGPGLGAASGRGSQHRLAMDADTAFQQLAATIQANNGEVTWQTGPHSANFRCVKKVFLSPSMKFEGDFNIAPVSETESIASIELKPDWGNLTGNIVFTLVCAVFMVVLNPMFLPLFMLIAIASVGYAAWSQMVHTPNKLIENFVRSMPKANAVGGFGPTSAFQTGTPAKPNATFGGDLKERLMSKLPPSASAMLNRVAPSSMTQTTTTPPLPPQPPVTHSVPTHRTVKSPIEQIKELASLKDAGAITEEEFETKKVELLKAI